MDYDLVQAGLIMMATIVVTLVIVVTGGAIIDETDYRLYQIDDGSYPKFMYIGHLVHDWFFQICGLLNLISFVWFVKVAIRRLGYNRSQGW